MMQRRDIERQLTLYDELSGILGAMKSFALVELRRVTKREEAEQHAVETVRQALDIMAPALPPTPQTSGDIWLLFGSTRGFCSSFNEDVLQMWKDKGGADSPTIAIGERLSLLLPKRSNIEWIPGASGAQDATETIAHLLSSIEKLRAKQSSEVGLVFCLHDEHETRTQRLLPLPVASSKGLSDLPHTNEPPAIVAESVAEHYLFHSLFAFLLRSLYVENHMRLMQMENALEHLERKKDEMQLMRNRMRQEEIVEEIERLCQSNN